MADHRRLDALTELVERSGAKLIAVGDGKQLPSIGPGGMFDRLTDQRPPRARGHPPHQRPRRAPGVGGAARGEPERAMAHYQARGPSCSLPTPARRPARQPYRHGPSSPETRDIREVALIADSSNVEIDRLNARAQHLRAERGELGDHESPAARHQHYGLREGDLITSPPSTANQGSRGSRTAPAARSRTISEATA